MDIKIVKPVAGYDQFKVGDVIKDAELLTGMALCRYLLETGFAQPVGAETKEKATILKDQTITPEK